MERRNLDLGLEVTRAQWEELGRTAQALGLERGGYGWEALRPDEIRVHLRRNDAPAGWRERLAEPEQYGAMSQEAGAFHFNGGRPFAQLHPFEAPEAPTFEEGETAAMQAELETWARGKWHELLRRSGLHYERGHIPQS